MWVFKYFPPKKDYCGFWDKPISLNFQTKPSVLWKIFHFDNLQNHKASQVGSPLDGSSWVPSTVFLTISHLQHLQHLQLSTTNWITIYLAILFWILTDVHQGHWITMDHIYLVYIWYTRGSGFSSNCFFSLSGLVGGCLPAQSRTCATRRVGGKAPGFHGDINSIHHKIVDI